MKTMKFSSYAELPTGSRVLLSGAQAAARDHLITADDPAALAADRKAVADAKKTLSAAQRDGKSKDIAAAEDALGKARAALGKARIYVAKAPLGFKGGEEVSVDEATSAQASRVSVDARQAGYDEGVKAGRRQMLDEVLARNSAIDRVETAEDALGKAQAALGAEKDQQKQDPLRKAVSAAETELTAAETALEALPELRA